jgi:putative membrane protein
VSDAVHDVFADWRLPWGLTVSLVLTAVVYLRGWLKIRRTRPVDFNSGRLTSFVGGLVVLWLAIGSPMDGFADALLSAHMVEHLALMSFVPPMVLYGWPAVPLLRGLPRFLVRGVVGPLLRVPGLRRFGHWLVTPVVAWFAMNGTLLAWHIPAAYDFALEHEGWHVVEHLCFLGTSLMFWWCLVRPWPSRTRPYSWGLLAYLLGADVVNTMLSAFLAFCDRPLYPYYATNVFHVSLMGDQELGAVVMWVVGSFVFLVPAVWVTLQLVGGPRRG